MGGPEQAGTGFDGRVVIVTGGATGLGLSYCREFAARGATVVVNDIGTSVHGRGMDAGVVRRATEEIRAAGGRAHAVIESVADETGCRRLIEDTASRFGRVDALVHNAGFVRSAPFAEYSSTDFAAVLDVHLGAAFHLGRFALPVMAEAGYGRIVLTTSGAGLWGRPHSPAYTAAKAGLIGLMHTLGIEGESSGVLTNAVSPIAVTRMAEAEGSGSGRLGAAMGSSDRLAAASGPEFVTPLVVYLASSACAVNRELYSAAAGRYARIAVGVGEGWRAPVDRPPRAEDIGAHLDAVRDITDLRVPESGLEELRLALQPKPAP